MADGTGVRDVFVEASDLRHHLSVRGAPGTPIVLMLHSLVGQSHVFDAIADRLAEKRHVYCLDFRGRGESAWGPEEEYRFESYVADLEAVREALGLQRFAIVGTSMGAGVGLVYAGQHPERVSHLVMNDIGPDVEQAGVQRIRNRTETTPIAFPDLKAAVRYYKESFPALANLSDERVSEFARWHIRRSDTGLYVWKMGPGRQARGRRRPAGGRALADLRGPALPRARDARRTQRHPQSRDRGADGAGAPQHDVGGDPWRCACTPAHGEGVDRRPRSLPPELSDRPGACLDRREWPDLRSRGQSKTRTAPIGEE